MFNTKTTLLSFALSLSLLSVGTLSHAKGISNEESRIGGYGEIGGNIDFFNFENFKGDDKDWPEQLTIKEARGVSGGVDRY